MAKVKVRLYAAFYEITKKKQLAVEAKDVSDVVDQLVKTFGKKFRNAILDKNGKLKPYHIILVNGIRIDLLNNFKTKLKEDDEIALFPPVGGVDSLMDRKAMITHVLPVFRGEEATDDVMDSKQSVIYDQAENGLFTKMAVLALTMQGLVKKI